MLSPFNNPIKKGSTKEAGLASCAIGLLSITLGTGSSSHETMAFDCLAVVTFVGANDLVETESSLTAMWDLIHPKSGSNVGTVRKPKPPVLAAALTTWTFLLTTTGSWRTSTDSWKGPIALLSTLLRAEDRAVRMATGEALASCFLNILDVSACEDADNDSGVAGGKA